MSKLDPTIADLMGLDPHHTMCEHGDDLWSLHYHASNGHATISLVRMIHDSLEEEIPVTLLIPDRKKNNTEDFIWALPIERVKWNKWYELAKTLKTVCQGIRYMQRKEDGKVITLLVMPNEKQSDDDAITACAYLRMVDKITCRIYILRCNDDATLTGGRLIDAVMGIDPDTLHDVDEAAIDKEYDAQKTKEKVDGK